MPIETNKFGKDEPMTRRNVEELKGIKIKERYHPLQGTTVQKPIVRSSRELNSNVDYVTISSDKSKKKK